MKIFHVEQDYNTCRKPFARSLGETYLFTPPCVVYGMLLSLVGEYKRAAHERVRLAFAHNRVPNISRTFHQQSRMKFSPGQKADPSASVPEFIESASPIDFLVAIDSGEEEEGRKLEDLVLLALTSPRSIVRRGPLYLGTSDNMVNSILPWRGEGEYHPLDPDPNGPINLSLKIVHGRVHGSRFANFRFRQDETVGDQWPRPESFCRIA
jgi:CRISPR-associated protein Cas5t